MVVVVVVLPAVLLRVQCHLLQLFLHRRLLLGDVAELGELLLGDGPAGLLGGALLGGQGPLGLAVAGDLLLQVALLHLQEVLGLLKPLLVLPALGLVCASTHTNTGTFGFCSSLFAVSSKCLRK